MRERCAGCEHICGAYCYDDSGFVTLRLIRERGALGHIRTSRAKTHHATRCPSDGSHSIVYHDTDVVTIVVTGALGDAAVTVRTLDGTAVAGRDFEGTMTEVKFASGESKGEVVVALLADGCTDIERIHAQSNQATTILVVSLVPSLRSVSAPASVHTRCADDGERTPASFTAELVEPRAQFPRHNPSLPLPN